ncbi:hypothetical protein [Methylobacterium fujisawaense]|uniref:hypothetical protein n=1 Tax=Methylobacterium fujisawaense TaxID=107400 RepID=UPI00313E572E
MTASTRRAALGAILAAPLASAPAIASTSALSDDEVRFVALGPQIVPMLDEYDRIWEAKAPFYEAWSKASEKIRGPSNGSEEIPEWHAYVESRRPADEIDNSLDEMLMPFEGIRFVSFEAIMLRHRIAMTFDYRADDVEADVRAYWEARACA